MSDRKYELLFIVNPSLSEAENETLVGQVKVIVEETGGAIDQVDVWGKKRLAYMINRHRDGFYVLITFDGAAPIVHEIERRLRVTDDVIKFMVVRVDVSNRKAERRKDRRVVRETRRKERFAARQVVPGVQ